MFGKSGTAQGLLQSLLSNASTFFSKLTKVDCNLINFLNLDQWTAPISTMPNLHTLYLYIGAIKPTQQQSTTTTSSTQFQLVQIKILHLTFEINSHNDLSCLPIVSLFPSIQEIYLQQDPMKGFQCIHCRWWKEVLINEEEQFGLDLVNQCLKMMFNPLKHCPNLGHIVYDCSDLALFVPYQKVWIKDML